MLHFIQVQLGSKTFSAVKVSTEGCSDVDDFKGAIKNKLPHLLAAFDAAQLSLFEPDGTTEIAPQTCVDDLKEIPWQPMVVKVEDLPLAISVSSSRKQQLTYKGGGMSTEASCRKYFDALALQLALFYEFDWGVDMNSSFPTIGDVFLAVKLKSWKYQTRKLMTLAEQRTNEAGFIEAPSMMKRVPKLPIPLPDLFDEYEWKRIKEFNNRKITDRIHDAALPKEKGKVFIVLPSAEFNDETVRFFKRIGVKGKLFAYEDDLIVKDEAELSGRLPALLIRKSE